MNAIPVIAGGAAVDTKPSVISGGAEVPVYDGYEIEGGQAVKIYQSAMEWTYAISMGSTSGLKDAGNSDVYSAYVIASPGSDGWCRVDYTFVEPILMRSGQTITCNLTHGDHPGNYTFRLFINGGEKYVGDAHSTIYSFTQDTTVTTIGTDVLAGGNEDFNMELDLACILSTDDGSFLLNNTGSSDQ